MYLMVWTQPDISHVVEVLNRYMLTPGKENWTTINRVFKYLCGIKDYCIFYRGRPRGDNGKLNVHGFVEVD